MARVEPAYVLTLPAQWQSLLLGDGRDESIDRIAREVTAQMPADSAASARHRFAARLRELAVSLSEAEGSQMAVVHFPQPRSAADLLPMTLSCGLAEGIDVPADKAARFLVSVAQTNPTAHPVDADGVVALRTVSIADVTRAVTAETERVTGESVDLGQVRAFQLRATYVFCQPQSDTWHMVVGSATVPDDDPESEIHAAVLELFDALMAGLRWVAKEAVNA